MGRTGWMSDMTRADLACPPPPHPPPPILDFGPKGRLRVPGPSEDSPGRETRDSSVLEETGSETKDGGGLIVSGGLIVLAVASADGRARIRGPSAEEQASASGPIGEGDAGSEGPQMATRHIRRTRITRMQG
eukprot:3933277-Pyramimonas_sp.AAC.1